MKPEELVTYCGIYGGTCARWEGYERFRELSALLAEWADSMGFRHWMPDTVDEFDYPNFRAGLGFFANKDSRLVCHRCCKGGDGYPECGLRKCCQARDVDLCFDCGEFPCDKTQIDPAMKKRAEQYRQLGPEAWLRQEVEKAGRGFEHHLGRFCHLRTSKELN